ncbi:MAG: hypothetical protein V2I43_23650, partial [Parvularcula sp.]|nr:hypothetical protein [Parvularcula sp.]
MRLATLIHHDLRTQYRYGIVVALIVATGAYALGLRLLGPIMTAELAAFILYTESSVLGFFLLGGLTLLEANEGGRTALGMTPVRSITYVLAKVLSLSLLCVAAGYLIALLGGLTLNPSLFLVIAVSSVFYTALGLAFSVRFSTITGYLFGGGAVLTLLILP